jgi:uncharacterized protein (TIGR00725 family)
VPTYVAVVGPGDETARPVNVAQAREVGRLLARAGAIVLTGGLGGVMAAATDGANDAGGVTVAFLPGTERGSNATVAIPTGLGELRNALLVRAADALIAVGGSWGTLSEIALARRTGVPVVVLDGWDVRDQRGEPLAARRADTPEQAVRQALAAADAASSTADSQPPG